MRSPKKVGGFTLAELLIAIAITALLIVILFQVFAATASQWQFSDQRIDAFRDARAAMQRMVQELGRANINGAAQMLTLSDPYNDFAKEVYAISPIANTGKSDLCTVGYYCYYDPTTHAYSLKRLFKTSDLTFTSLAMSSPDYTTLYQKDSPSADEVAAAYVWDLQIRPGTGPNVVSITSAPSTWNWLEVRFKAMSPASGRKIRSSSIDLSTWFNSTSQLYKTYILPYEQQFVSRVTLQQNQ
jgi:type II secretory pathway pseudopilin PulG